MPTSYGQLFGAVCLIFIATFGGVRVDATKDLFTNSFLVKFRQNVDNKLAHHVATRNGFVNLGPVSSTKYLINFPYSAIKFSQNFCIAICIVPKLGYKNDLGIPP